MKLLISLPAAFILSVMGLQAQSTVSLKQAIETALAGNITMKQGAAGIEAARIGLQQARMNRLPSLNAGAGQSINYGRSVNPFDNQVVENERVGSNNMSLSASVNLFSGFQNRYSIEQKQLDLKAGNEDLGSTRNNVILGVVESYANVLSNKALLTSARSQFESTQAQLERTEKLVNAGKIASAALFDLRSQLATDETGIVLAENNLELARLNLAQWMQISPESLGEVQEPTLRLESGPEKSSAEIYRLAESAQPQIQAARTRVLSAEKGIDLARSAYYPSLSLQGGIFTNYSSLAQRFIPGEKLSSPYYQPFGEFEISDPTNGTSVPVVISQKVSQAPGKLEDLSFSQQLDNNLRRGISLNLNIPIFNGYQARYSHENARIARKNAELQLEQEKNRLRQTIESAVANEKAARKRLEAIEKQIKALEENWRLSEQRFNLGVLNATDYLLAKNNLNRAENDRARFRYDFFIRRALLDFYIGKELDFN
jgi:outer membrane protein